MKHVLGVSLALVGLLAALLPAQAGLGKVVANYDNWEVRHSVDGMTDKVECLATYKGNSGIQLSKTALYISVRGGPKGYEYRLDDQPKSEMVLVSGILRDVGAIGFEGGLLNRIVQSHRLRIQVLTYLDLKEFDLDLNGIRNAYGASIIAVERSEPCAFIAASFSPLRSLCPPRRTYTVRTSRRSPPRVFCIGP